MFHVVLYAHSVISIHSLPKEGDDERSELIGQRAAFQSTPSPRRETFVLIARPFRTLFQSTPSPRRETRACPRLSQT